MDDHRGMDDDGRSGEARGRVARGTMPHTVTSQRRTAGVAAPIAQPSAADEPARSITEAIERLVAAEEADEAVAEWMQGERG